VNPISIPDAQVVMPRWRSSILGMQSWVLRYSVGGARPWDQALKFCGFGCTQT